MHELGYLDDPGVRARVAGGPGAARRAVSSSTSAALRDAHSERRTFHPGEVWRIRARVAVPAGTHGTSAGVPGVGESTATSACRPGDLVQGRRTRLARRPRPGASAPRFDFDLKCFHPVVLDMGAWVSISSAPSSTRITSLTGSPSCRGHLGDAIEEPVDEMIGSRLTVRDVPRRVVDQLLRLRCRASATPHAPPSLIAHRRIIVSVASGWNCVQKLRPSCQACGRPHCVRARPTRRNGDDVVVPLHPMDLRDHLGHVADDLLPTDLRLACALHCPANACAMIWLP
jgi:hypothetical protein